MVLGARRTQKRFNHAQFDDQNIKHGPRTYHHIIIIVYIFI